MWKPWVGTHYGEQRTLLLVESCYDWIDQGELHTPQPDHPTLIVSESMAEPQKGADTMIKLTQAICCAANPTSQQSTEAWQRFALTNYIPVSAGHGAGPKPREADWRQAEEEWPDVLAHLRPRTVIVLGKVMWNRMPKTQKTVGVDIQGYELPDGTYAMCFALHHPSRGPAWSHYAAEIQKAENAHRT